jgi:hypothetical protein
LEMNFVRFFKNEFFNLNYWNFEIFYWFK